MIPRRLYEHVKTHNWFAVVIDLVIVVVGVFIGIQVSNWNADRLERNAAKTYIARIREDLAAGVQSLQQEQRYYRAVKAHALDALIGFEKPVDQLDEQFLIDAYNASRLIDRTIERSTFDQILSTGAMNSIQNIEVWARISIFYRSVESTDQVIERMPPYRQNLRRHMPYSVQAAMVERCDNERVFDSRGFVIVTIRENCKLDLPAETVAAGVIAIRRPELKLDLTYRLNDLDMRILYCERLIEQAQRLDHFLAEAEM